MIKNKYNILGLMSGTSLDGLDLCWVEFSKKLNWEYKILAADTLAYTPVMKSELQTCLTKSPKALSVLNQSYTIYIGQLINSFINTHHIKNLDAVCSHGHTVFHQPQKGLTLQIGNLPELANYISQTLVCDFRVQDVVMGGQGAPLVPVGDALLFSKYDFCLNLGGFANISFQVKNQRIAFDICPTNITLNHYAEILGQPYDVDGKIAAKGRLHPPLLEALNELDFYKKQPPKSLGLEWVQSEVFPIINNYSLEPSSVLRTLVEHTASQIANVIVSQNLQTGLFSGGGVLNSFLMQRIAQILDRPIPPTNGKLIHYKEALVFGFLGVLKLRQEINCLRSVTGAKEDHSSGKIYYPSQRVNA